MSGNIEWRALTGTLATMLHTEAAARALVLERIAKMDAGDDE